jgi:hypothetical protein
MLLAVAFSWPVPKQKITKLPPDLGLSDPARLNTDHLGKQTAYLVQLGGFEPPTS